MFAVTVFHQEVELKYHQLCQGDQEAATSEDGNNQGGLQVAELMEAGNSMSATCFSDGIQR